MSKLTFAEQIALKVCQRIKIIHQTKLRVISRGEYASKLEHVNPEFRLTNQPNYTEHDFCMTYLKEDSGKIRVLKH